MKRTLAFATALLASCALTSTPKSGVDKYFLTEVKPVLQETGLLCHNGTLPPPALNLTSKATAFRDNGKGRYYILPGDPDCSLLIGSVQRDGTHPKLMPRAEISLTDDDIGMLREWIEDGAKWPAGERGMLHAPANHPQP